MQHVRRRGQNTEVSVLRVSLVHRTHVRSAAPTPYLFTNLLSVPFVWTPLGNFRPQTLCAPLPPNPGYATGPDTLRRHLKTNCCQQAFQST